jgi:integrase
MASASNTTRRRTSGTRYVVRYRLGGRTYPLQHAGAFKTQKDAKVRLGFVAGELAAGRNPADLLNAMSDSPVVRTFDQWTTEYAQTPVDIAGKTHKAVASHLAKLAKTFGDRDPATITVGQVQAWIVSTGLMPNSVSRYLQTFRDLLDFAGVEPNPARDPKLRLPRVESKILEPPSGADVEAMLANMLPRWRLPFRVLEQTGMRIGELEQLEWRDVDVAGSRFRIRNGKTATARRWVMVPEWVVDEINLTCPHDDRVPERRVFVGFKAPSLAYAMRRACQSSGVAHYHPHDLRHRYASVKVAEGVPVTALAAQLGHTKKSLTLDTHSHVLMAN